MLRSPPSCAASRHRRLPTPPDQLPTPQLKLPKGFKIEVYASGIANARSLRIGDKGTVFVSNRLLDKVYAIVDRNGKREAKVIASGLDRPNGLAFHNGTLYIAEGTQISKLEKIEDNLDNPPKPVVIYSDFLNHQSHGWKFMGLGPDNKLYVNVGSPCNICEPPETNGQIRRINLDGSGAEVVARGVRNSVGFDWHPVTKELYFTDNGRDWLSEDLPEDELNRVTKIGQHFGFPYCHQGTFTDREMGWGRSCDEFEKPVALLGPHSAALGMRFYTGNMFPAEYRNAIFIARHGSWNRTKKIGGDVVVAKLNKDGSVKSMEPFLTGFLQNNDYIGRPVDVQVMKDGSLLVSDDYAGAVYRVTYGGSKVAAPLSVRPRRVQGGRGLRRGALHCHRRRRRWSVTGAALAAGGGLTRGAARAVPRLPWRAGPIGDMPEVPSLGAQPAFYVMVQLYMFREKLRAVEAMNAMTQGSATTIYAAWPMPLPNCRRRGQPAGTPTPPGSTGRARSSSSTAATSVIPQIFRRAEVPRLAGQREDYLVKALREYKNNTRRGYDAAMADVLYQISDEQILDLAYFLARRP